MIDNVFRSHLPKFTARLISLYKFLRLTPNQITLIALSLACASAFLIVQGLYALAILVWWLGRLLDGTDGIYARATNQASLFGAYLDIICDMASYSVMILAFGISFREYQILWLVIMFLYVLCITGALALGTLEIKSLTSPHDNRGLRLAAGLAEGGETGIAYTIFLLFPSQLKILIWIWIIILIVTVISRTVLAFYGLQSRKPQ